MIRAIVFDWGDTVMRDLPGMPGPMADWPRVELVPGIEEALEALGRRYLLALATNAADSGEAKVRQALARVGVERHFSAVLTARELEVRKPDPAFYRLVLAECRCAANEAIMVGDNLEADARGAMAAGLRAVWLNPTGARPGPGPVPDAEIAGLGGLVDAVGALDRPG